MNIVIIHAEDEEDPPEVRQEEAEGQVIISPECAIRATKRGIMPITAQTKNNMEESLVQFLDPRYESSTFSMPQPASTFTTNHDTSTFNYLLADLESQCPAEDLEFFQSLQSLQKSILDKGFVEQTSIHNKGAIKFYSEILSADEKVLDILSSGYLPGK